jgi:hypothetical protein
MDTWLRRLTSIGLLRGLRGSRAWMITAAAAIGLRGLRRMAHPPPKVLYRTVVTSSDRFEIVARRRIRGRKATRTGK